MDNFAPTERTEVRRLPKRAVYDREVVFSILDEALICHVGFTDNGRPVVIPTGFGRKDDTLYIHGSAASRMLRTLGKGIEVCVTVTLLDGLVMARSAFHHSMNYRSVVIFGTATVVEEPEEKVEALRIFTEHVACGRWEEVRKPTPQELKATAVLALSLQEVSAKVRTGPPLDDEEDYCWPVWAGVLPLHVTPDPPLADGRLPEGISVPEYLRDYARRRS
jgi:uncharacterized protein